jgi:amidohydrolase family protein
MTTARISLVVFASLSCATARNDSSPRADLAITHVAVVDPANDRLRSDQTVLITAGRVSDIVPATSAIPNSARVIDGTGKYVIPGLWDMHAHLFVAGPLTELDLPLFIAHGVTGLRVLNADCRLPATTRVGCIEQYRELQRQIESGSVLGPRLLALGSWPVNGNEGITDAMPAFFKAATEEDGRKLARYFKERGVDFIKVYDGIPREGFLGLTDEARKLGLPFAGHEPRAFSAIELSDIGQRSLEHSRTFLVNCSSVADSARRGLLRLSNTQLRQRMVDEYDAALCADVFRAFVRNRTFITPTHGTRKLDAFAHDSAYRNDPRLKYVPPILRFRWTIDANRMVASDSSVAGRKSFMDFYRKGIELTGAAHRAGVRVMVGTDSNDSFVFVGSSVHDELEQLIAAGLTPAQALDAATRSGAEYLGRTSEFGSVQPGRAADLVLLDANPLADIRNTRRIHAVLFNGRYLSRAALDSLLAVAEAAAKR